MRRAWVLFVGALWSGILLVPVGTAVDPVVSPECLGTGDASDDGHAPGPPVLGRECYGTVGGVDPADWYELVFVGPLQVFVQACVSGLPAGSLLHVDVYWSPLWGERIFQWRNTLESHCFAYLVQYGTDGLPAGELSFRFSVEGEGTATYRFLLDHAI